MLASRLTQWLLWASSLCCLLNLCSLGTHFPFPSFGFLYNPDISAVLSLGPQLLPPCFAPWFSLLSWLQSCLSWFFWSWNCFFAFTFPSFPFPLFLSFLLLFFLSPFFSSSVPYPFMALFNLWPYSVYFLLSPFWTLLMLLAALSPLCLC